jgi:hypothetical protein
MTKTAKRSLIKLSLEKFVAIIGASGQLESYIYENPDEERRPWNDPTVIPKIINGRVDDDRCNKPWDWFYLPYR